MTKRPGARRRADDAEATRDAVLAARAADGRSGAAGDAVVATELAAVRAAHQRVLTALQEAKSAMGDAGRLLAEAGTTVAAVPATGLRRRREDRPKRLPIQVPGGVYADSAAMAEYLLRTEGIVVLIDGYNVAKLGWQGFTLEVQRERLIATAEDIARRWGTDITVVFDGADIPGAAAPTRRLVRVTFSPAGVIADDVLRAEVGSLPLTQPVLVVTNDQAMVTRRARRRGQHDHQRPVPGRRPPLRETASHPFVIMRSQVESDGRSARAPHRCFGIQCHRLVRHVCHAGQRALRGLPAHAHRRPGTGRRWCSTGWNNG